MKSRKGKEFNGEGGVAGEAEGTGYKRESSRLFASLHGIGRVRTA